MNRRSFLKRCSILHFVGSLSILSDSGASEGKVKASMCATEIDGLMNSSSNIDPNKYLYIWYDFTEKVKMIYEVDGDVYTIIRYEKFSEPPFFSCGKTQEKINSGEITNFIQKI